MKAFTLRDIEAIRPGQAIVGRSSQLGLMGFVIPASICNNGKKYQWLMEIFFRIFDKLSDRGMWRGYIVDVDLETDGPIKLLFEEVAPRAYISISPKEAAKRADKTYYTFI